jgi:hypothetical protein
MPRNPRLAGTRSLLTLGGLTQSGGVWQLKSYRPRRPDDGLGGQRNRQWRVQQAGPAVLFPFEHIQRAEVLELPFAVLDDSP